MKTVLFRTVNGDIVIGEVAKEVNNAFDTSIEVMNPCMLVPQGKAIGLMPYMPFADANPISEKVVVTFSGRNIVAFANEISIELFNHYQQQFGSGIVIPTKEANLN